MQHRLAAVHVLDEAADAAGVGEIFALAVALVDELDLDAVVQERELADSLRQDVVVVLDAPEGLERCHEMHFGAAAVGRAGRRERRLRDAAAELHLVGLPLRQMRSLSQSESALTTDTPTPCRPPETL